MTFAIIGVAGLLLMLGLVLLAVLRVRPELFRLKATVTKLVSFDLEMRSPRKPDRIDRTPGPPG